MTEFFIPASKNSAQVQMASGISASGDTIQLKSGEAALLPTGQTGTATSAGTAETLNSTGIGARVSVNDFIRNTTDGSGAWVLSVSTNSITTTKLIGGVDNTWDSADEWVVGSTFAWLSKKDISGGDTTRELVKVSYIDIATDQVHIETRAVEGTATAFAADDYVSIYISAQFVQEIGKGIQEMQDRKADKTEAVLQSVGTTDGDLMYFDGTEWVRLGIGSIGDVLTVSGGVPVWNASAGSPTTTEGDLIVRGASVDERLAIGTSGKVLTSNGTTAVWDTLPAAPVTKTTLGSVTSFGATTSFAKLFDIASSVIGFDKLLLKLKISSVTNNNTLGLRFNNDATSGEHKLNNAAATQWSILLEAGNGAREVIYELTTSNIANPAASTPIQKIRGLNLDTDQTLSYTETSSPYTITSLYLALSAGTASVNAELVGIKYTAL